MGLIQKLFSGSQSQKADSSQNSSPAKPGAVAAKPGDKECALCGTVVEPDRSRCFKCGSTNLIAVVDKSARRAAPAAPPAAATADGPKRSFTLWMQNTGQASNIKLVLFALQEKKAPRWVISQANVGEYRVERDTEHGGCNIVFE